MATFVREAADDVEKVPMMGGPAKKLGSAAGQIHDTTGALGSLADDLVGLAEILAAVGAALGRLGDHLDASGSEAKGLVATP